MHCACTCYTGVGRMVLNMESGKVNIIKKTGSNIILFIQRSWKCKFDIHIARG
jgi:hypothetical protein